MDSPWPPTEPFDDRRPWPPTLPGRAERGFPVAMGIGGLGNPNVMAAMWCRTTLDDAHAYYQAARQAAWANWAIERIEDWSPTEAEFARWIQDLWLPGCRLLISAQLAQQWVRVADPRVQPVPGLRVARNSIEHLFEAEFDAEHLVATSRIDENGKPAGAWDIGKLPEGHLIMGLGKDPLNVVFEAVSLLAIVEFADQHSRRDADVELDDAAFLLRPPT